MALKGEVGLYLSGQPVPVKECNLVIVQPKIKDIVALMGEDDFLTATQIIAHVDVLVDSLRKGNLELNFLSDFQMLLVILREDIRTKKAIKSLFDLILPNYTVKFEETGIEFFLDESLVSILNPHNFEAFQRVITELFEPQIDGEEEFNPVDDKAREIAEKLKKGREKRNQLKAANSKEKPVTSMYSVQTSVLSIGLGVSINMFYDYTPFQLNDAFIRYTSKMASDFYRRVSTMPFMDTSKMEAPEEWTRGLY